MCVGLIARVAANLQPWKKVNPYTEKGRAKTWKEPGSSVIVLRC